MLRKSRRFAVAILLVSSIIVSGCGAKSKLRIMLEASDSIADSGKVTLNLAEQLGDDHTISNTTINKVIDVVEQTNIANETLNNGLRDLIEHTTANLLTIPQLIAVLNDVDRQLDIFNNTFIAQQTNVRVKTICLTYYTAIKASISTIRLTYMSILTGTGNK